MSRGQHPKPGRYPAAPGDHLVISSSEMSSRTTIASLSLPHLGRNIQILARREKNEKGSGVYGGVFISVVGAGADE